MMSRCLIKLIKKNISRNRNSNKNRNKDKKKGSICLV